MSGLKGLDFENLKEGDLVEFDVEKNKRGRGLRTVSVRTASES